MIAPLFVGRSKSIKFEAIIDDNKEIVHLTKPSIEDPNAKHLHGYFRNNITNAKVT